MSVLVSYQKKLRIGNYTMIKPDWDDSNWREEYKEMKLLSKLQLELLNNGPRSLSQSWLLGAMHSDWRRKKGYVYPEPPDCSSSLQEFFEKTKGI